MYAHECVVRNLITENGTTRSGAGIKSRCPVPYVLCVMRNVRGTVTVFFCWSTRCINETKKDVREILSSLKLGWREGEIGSTRAACRERRGSFWSPS